MLVKKNGFWGVINANNKVCIPIIHDEIKFQDHKVFLLKRKDKWGAVKLRKEFALELLLDIKYDSIQLTNDSWNGDFIVKNKGERFYIFRTDSKNEIPIKDYKVYWINSIDSFKMISIFTKSGKIAYIGENGTYFFEE